MISLIQQHHTELDALCRRFGVRRLDLFGSAARGDFSPDSSDLDFLVQFSEPGEVGYAFRYLRLAESLEALFDRRVDLLTENMVRDAAFRNAVDQYRQVVYEC